MQVGGVEQGVKTIPRRDRLAMLLAIATIVVITAVAALLLVWGFPPAASGVGTGDANVNVGAAVIHDDAGNMHPEASPAVIHDDAGNLR